MEKQYTIDDLYRDAGIGLANMVINLFEGHKDSSVSWFYRPNRALGYKTPYEACKEGNPGEVERIIGCLEHGVFL